LVCVNNDTINARTNQNGQFYIDSLLVKDYSLRISAKGYIPDFSFSFTVLADSTIEVDGRFDDHATKLYKFGENEPENLKSFLPITDSASFYPNSIGYDGYEDSLYVACINEVVFNEVNENEIANIDSLMTLSGRIIDDTYFVPVWGANISISGYPIRTKSDEDGKFVLGGIEKGMQVLTISSVGYGLVSFGIDIGICHNILVKLPQTIIETHHSVIIKKQN
jgi:hypothetical protein